MCQSVCRWERELTECWCSGWWSYWRTLCRSLDSHCHCRCLLETLVSAHTHTHTHLNTHRHMYTHAHTVHTDTYSCVMAPPIHLSVWSMVTHYAHTHRETHIHNNAHTHTLTHSRTHTHTRSRYNGPFGYSNLRRRPPGERVQMFRDEGILYV